MMSNLIFKNLEINSCYWAFGYVSKKDRVNDEYAGPSFCQMYDNPIDYKKDLPVFDARASFDDEMKFNGPNIKFYKAKNGIILDEEGIRTCFLPYEQQIKTKFLLAFPRTKYSIEYSNYRTVTPYKIIPAQFVSHVFMRPIK